MMNKRKKVFNRVLEIMLCLMMVGIVILLINIRNIDLKKKSFAREVNTLEEKNSKLNNDFNSNKESFKSQQESLNNKINELESEKESLCNRNNELESLAIESGIKEKIDENSKIVFLTFDDGPSDLTPDFINVLDKYNVNGTFFVTYQPQYESTYKLLAEHGNSIQIHTASHDYNTIYSSEEEYMKDFNKILEYIKTVTNTTPNYFRFPGGSTNSYGGGIVKQIARDMKTNGFDFVDWNVSVGDGSAAATKDSIIAKIKSESEGKNHIVMLAHDSGTKTETLAALPEIIEYYKEAGYSFGVISGDVDISFAQFIDY